MSAEVFTEYYRNANAGWGASSGPGSEPFYTVPYRSFLENFIFMNQIKSVVDVGCGDWAFSRFINFTNTQYLGLDVVEQVISHNNAHFAEDNIAFRLMPAASEVPAADLLVMKDVLQHLPFDEIFEMRRSLFPRFRHVLLTNSYEKLNTYRNTDIVAGDFRCLDLSAAPFGFKGAYLVEFSSVVWERIRVFHYTG